jgi:ribose transport system permease protein
LGGVIEHRSRLARFAGRLQALNVQAVLGLLLLIIVGSLFSDVFMTGANWSNIMRQVAVNGIIAIGMTFVILTAGIDLSVGSILALVTALAAGFSVNLGLPVPVAALVGLAAGAGCGCVNGVLITFGRMQPFVATLAMMASARGFAFLYTSGFPIDLPPTSGFFFLGERMNALWGVPVPGLLFLGVAAAAYVVLKKTPFGRYVYAVGGNEEACRLSGVRVDRVKIFVYAISGFLTGLAALVHMARIHQGRASEGIAFELDAIAAVVIGGTSLQGGIGTLGGTVIGALILTVLNNVLGLRNVHPYVQQCIKGGVIVAAVLVQRRRT